MQSVGIRTKMSENKLWGMTGTGRENVMAGYTGNQTKRYGRTLLVWNAGTMKGSISWLFSSNDEIRLQPCDHYVAVWPHSMNCGFCHLFKKKRKKEQPRAENKWHWLQSQVMKSMEETSKIHVRMCCNIDLQVLCFPFGRRLKVLMNKSRNSRKRKNCLVMKMIDWCCPASGPNWCGASHTVGFFLHSSFSEDIR